jgi:ligand-binding SRPBCC domain-containing protein
MEATKTLNKKVYSKSTTYKTTLANMIKLHTTISPAQLTPPPIFVQTHRDERKSMNEGELEFTLWMGFIPVRWLARHEQGPTTTSFADVMVEGPLAYWRHEHIFTPNDNGVELTDRVTLAHHSGFKGILTRLAFDGIPLRILFFFRHLKTWWLLRQMK